MHTCECCDPQGVAAGPHAASSSSILSHAMSGVLFSDSASAARLLHCLLSSRRPIARHPITVVVVIVVVVVVVAVVFLEHCSWEGLEGHSLSRVLTILASCTLRSASRLCPISLALDDCVHDGQSPLLDVPPLPSTSTSPSRFVPSDGIWKGIAAVALCRFRLCQNVCMCVGPVRCFARPLASTLPQLSLSCHQSATKPTRRVD